MDELQAEDVKEILNYVNLIKNHEVTTQRGIDGSISLVWAILFIFAGITDLLLELSASPMLASFSWALASIGGVTYSYLIMRYFRAGYVTEVGKSTLDKSKYAFSRILKLMFVVTMVTTLIFVNLVIFNTDLIIPFLVFVIGTVFLYLNVRSKRLVEKAEIQPPGYFIWVLPYFSSALSIVLYYTVGPVMINYFGLIMGLTLGTINLLNFLSGIREGKKVNN